MKILFSGKEKNVVGLGRHKPTQAFPRSLYKDRKKRHFELHPKVILRKYEMCNKSES